MGKLDSRKILGKLSRNKERKSLLQYITCVLFLFQMGVCAYCSNPFCTAAIALLPPQCGKMSTGRLEATCSNVFQPGHLWGDTDASTTLPHPTYKHQRLWAHSQSLEVIGSQWRPLAAIGGGGGFLHTTQRRYRAGQENLMSSNNHNQSDSGQYGEKLDPG